MTGYATRAELQRMVDACPADTLAGKRDRLLLVVLRALNGRSRELTALLLEDTGPYKNSLALVVNDEALYIPTGEYTDHDPCALWKAWVATLPDTFEQGAQAEPLFRAVTKDDRLRVQASLGSKYVGQIVKRAAARAGLDNPERYNARLFRDHHAECPTCSKPLTRNEARSLNSACKTQHNEGLQT